MQINISDSYLASSNISPYFDVELHSGMNNWSALSLAVPNLTDLWMGISTNESADQLFIPECSGVQFHIKIRAYIFSTWETRLRNRFDSEYTTLYWITLHNIRVSTENLNIRKFSKFRKKHLCNLQYLFHINTKTIDRYKIVYINMYIKLYFA